MGTDGIRVKLDCEETTGAIIGCHPYITSLSAVHKDFASRSERQYYKISSSGLFQSKNYIKMPTFDFLFTGQCTVCAFSSSFILILLTVPCSLILFCVLFLMKGWAGGWGNSAAVSLPQQVGDYQNDFLPPLLVLFVPVKSSSEF